MPIIYVNLIIIMTLSQTKIGGCSFFPPFLDHVPGAIDSLE